MVPKKRQASNAVGIPVAVGCNLALNHSCLELILSMVERLTGKVKRTLAVALDEAKAWLAVC